MAEDRTQGSRVWMWVGAAVVLAGVFFGARSLLRDKLLIRVAQADREPLVNRVSTNAHVEPEMNYQFYSPLTTTVKAVYVQPGDKVPAGKLLLVLEDLEARARVASAESGVKNAQAALEAATHNGTQEQRQATEAEIERDQLDASQAQRDLDALTKLEAGGAASAGEVAAAKQRLESAEESLKAAEQSAHSRYSPDEVARAQAALADARAGLAEAEHVLSQTRIVAPAAGTVYSMDASPSEYAEQGKLLLQLADLTKERVRAYFDEPDLGRLAVGQKIVIEWNAKPGQEWTGYIERMPVTVVSYMTRTVGEVLVHIDGENSGLLPDTDVTVTVTTASQSDALSVPREALHPENGRYYVYKVVGSELVRTEVTTGAFNMTREAILSGLKEGDSVATGTTNGQPLQEGMPIKVVH